MLEAMGKVDWKQVLNSFHNTRAMGCQTKLQHVITLQNTLPQDIKAYTGSKIKWNTGSTRETLVRAYLALQCFPRHPLVHCHKQALGLGRSMNIYWAKQIYYNPLHNTQELHSVTDLTQMKCYCIFCVVQKQYRRSLGNSIWNFLIFTKEEKSLNGPYPA